MLLRKSCILNLDACYRDNGSIDLSLRNKINFDHPKALDWQLIEDHILKLKGGNFVNIPKYSFASYCREKEHQRKFPEDVIILEDVFALYDEVIVSQGQT